jgi:hypothetical protein
MNGKSNAEFSWFIIAVRKDEVDENGNIISKYQDVRFPIFPDMGKVINIQHQLPNIQEK